MEDYKNNSIAASKKKDVNIDIPEKNVAKVVQGEVSTKKRNQLLTDLTAAWACVRDDVIKPALKKTAVDTITRGINTLIYGDGGRDSRDLDRGVSYRSESYRSYYGERDRVPVRPYAYDEITYSNITDANYVLDGMIDILSKYGSVSIADMCDLVGTRSNYTDNKYGWNDLRTARVERDYSGKYYIKLPRVIQL